MAEKMCKVSDLEARYTYKSLAPWKNEIGGGVNKCLKVKDFLQYFEKTNYELSVPNRNEMRLFPLSSISEKLLVKQPSLTFDSSSVFDEDDAFSFDNGYTYENLQGPWTVEIINPSISDHITVSLDDAGGFVIIECDQNTTDDNFTCQIKLTGTRVDGLGTYSATFNVLQNSRLIALKITIQNANPNDNFTVSNPISFSTELNYNDETTIYLLNRSTTKSKYSIYDTSFQLDSQNRESYNIKVYNNGGDYLNENCLATSTYTFSEFNNFGGDNTEFKMDIYAIGTNTVKS